MKQKNFKVVSLLTIFTIVLNVLSAVVLLQPVHAAVTAVTLDTYVASATSVTMTITGDGTLNLPSATWVSVVGDGTTCTYSDPTLTCTGSGTATVTNPATPGSYNLGPVAVPIVDSETVTVTGYINTTITFDIDTDETTTTDCAVNVCTAHSGAVNPAGAYTVDLGNLTTADVSKSGDTGALHASAYGGTFTGDINYIMLDLSTNAYGGAVVTMASANGRLDHPTADTAYDIPGVTADGTDIEPNTPGYGVKFAQIVAAGTGTGLTLDADCEVLDTGYCAPTVAAREIYNTSGDAIQDSRVALEVAAAINGTMPAGTYTDTLTFIATATF